jgi:DNA-3-methyladenine glycosylase
MSKLNHFFYRRSDTLQIAKDLLGKFLFSKINGELTGGLIVETEAYVGIEDKACHAYANRRTPRTEVMYSQGGVTYVYLCYGIHALFNIVTNTVDEPHAVLIRAIEPTVGINIMLQRRKKTKLEASLTAGPGSLTQALGITCLHNNLDLMGEVIWIEEREQKIKSENIICSPRVGINYAAEFVHKPWRFRIADNKWVSKAK